MSVVNFRLGEPPAGRVFCAICVGTLKSVIETLLKDRLNEIVDDGQTGFVDITMADVTGVQNLPPVNLAVTRSFHGPLRAAGFTDALDVCWTHTISFTFQQMSVTPATPGQERQVAATLEAMGAKVIGHRRARDGSDRPSHFPPQALPGAP